MTRRARGFPHNLGARYRKQILDADTLVANGSLIVPVVRDTMKTFKGIQRILQNFVDADVEAARCRNVSELDELQLQLDELHIVRIIMSYRLGLMFLQSFREVFLLSKGLADLGKSAVLGRCDHLCW